MSEELDRRIADLFHADAPPARDPVFRLKVLERRERRQFQRRVFTMLAGMVVILLVLTFAIGTGRGALPPTGVLVVGTAVATAYCAFRGRLRLILRRFSI